MSGCQDVPRGRELLTERERERGREPVDKMICSVWCSMNVPAQAGFSLFFLCLLCSALFRFPSGLSPGRSTLCRLYQSRPARRVDWGLRGLGSTDDRVTPTIWREFDTETGLSEVIGCDNLVVVVALVVVAPNAVRPRTSGRRVARGRWSTRCLLCRPINYPRSRNPHRRHRQRIIYPRLCYC